MRRVVLVACLLCAVSSRPMINVMRPSNGTNFFDGESIVVEVNVDGFDIPQTGRFELLVNGGLVHESQVHRISMILPAYQPQQYAGQVRLVLKDGTPLGVSEDFWFTVGDDFTWFAKIQDAFSDFGEPDVGVTDTACPTELVEEWEGAFLEPEMWDAVRRDIHAAGVAMAPDSNAQPPELVLEVSKQCLELVSDLKRASRARMFQRVFDEHGRVWFGETVSGWAAETPVAGGAVQALQWVLGDTNVETVLDLGSGGFHWASDVDWGPTHYTAFDIVPALHHNYPTKHGVKFVVGDFVTEVPRADLVIVRDALQHNSLRDVAATLCNIWQSKAQWILVSSERHVTTNTDIFEHGRGHHRPLNLQRAPLSLPEPWTAFDESDADFARHGRSLQLHKRDALGELCSSGWEGAVDEYLATLSTTAHTDTVEGGQSDSKTCTGTHCAKKEGSKKGNKTYTDDWDDDLDWHSVDLRCTTDVCLQRDLMHSHP